MAFITEGRVCRCHTVSTATVYPCSDQISFFLVSGNSCFRLLVHLFASGKFNRNVSEMNTESAATAFVEIKNNIHPLLPLLSIQCFPQPQLEPMLVSMASLLMWPKISSLRDPNFWSPSSSQSAAALVFKLLLVFTLEQKKFQSQENTRGLASLLEKGKESTANKMQLSASNLQY